MIDRAAELDDVAAADAAPARSAGAATLWLPSARREVLGLVHGPAPPAALLLRLQQGAGNRAVGAVLQRCACGCGGAATCHEDEASDERAVSRAVLQLKARLGAAAIQRDEDEEPGAPVALDDAPAAAGGAGAGTPTFNHSSTTVKIDADSAIDFSNKITAQIGSPHTEITLEPDVQYDFKTGDGGKEIPGTQKIVSVGLTVTTKIVKVRFGMGRPNEKHKKAIDEMVAAIQAHEEQHRAIVVAEATAALKKAQKLVGTNKVKEAYKILDAVDCAAAKRHEELDAKEGLLTASENADGDVSISKSASGAKYPCGAAAKSP
jgi:hypothetical protein